MNPSPAPVTVYKNENVELLRSLAVCAAVNDPSKNLEQNQNDTNPKTEATEKAIQQLLSDCRMWHNRKNINLKCL